jgi:hypothetical protein
MLEYHARLIKQQSTSELLRFTIRHILNQVNNDQIYHYLEQEQQKKAQNQQQQELSEKARQNLQCISELRNKDSKYFNQQPGEKSNWIFDAEKIQPVKNLM